MRILQDHLYEAVSHRAVGYTGPETVSRLSPTPFVALQGSRGTCTLNEPKFNFLYPALVLRALRNRTEKRYEVRKNIVIKTGH